MANKFSFDVSTGVDLQEVDNAINQALKEIGQRFDFKGAKCSIELDRAKGIVRLEADDDFRMKALSDVLEGRLIKRGVPLKNLKFPEPAPGAAPSLGRVRKEITLTQGIDQETAKKITKAFKEQKFNKVQITIQGQELRVSSASKDDLQAVMTYLRSQDFGVELKFGNYR